MPNPTLKVLLNDVDVTNAYATDEGRYEITDGMNQPMTCSLTFLSHLLPGPAAGGALLTIKDSSQIHFDGVIPVEAGLGTEFLYLEQIGGDVYRAKARVQAVDYQAVLDHVNLPDKTFFFQDAGTIVQELIGLSVLKGKVNFDQVSTGFVIEEYRVAGRKFSQVVKELAGMNGFYFSLRTTALTPREFAAEFRSLAVRPCPIIIDRDALKYDISSLRFDPRDKPLANRVTIVGGTEPSDETRVDTFQCDGVTGSWTLSQVPFYLRSSEIAGSAFDAALNPDDVTVSSGAVFSTSGGLLQISGSGVFSFNKAFQSRLFRYTTWQDVIFEAGASVMFGLSVDQVTTDETQIACGVWFKGDGSISVIQGGVDIPAVKGMPTWVAGESYSIRVKETPLGCYAEIKGGGLAPVRHWMPITPTGTLSHGEFAIDEASPGDWSTAQVGDMLVVALYKLDPPNDTIFVAYYPMTAADIADTSRMTYHRNVANFLDAKDALHTSYRAYQKEDAQGVIAITNTLGSPIRLQLTAAHGWTTGTVIHVENCPIAEANGDRPVTVTAADEIELDGTVGTGVTWTPVPGEGGTAKLFLAGVSIDARLPGEEWDCGLYITIFRQPPGGPTTQPTWYTRTEFNIVGGAIPGIDLATSGAYFFSAIVADGGDSNVAAVYTRDALGIDVRLERDSDVLLAVEEGDRSRLAAPHAIVSLTVGSADEFDDSFSCQVALQGESAILSFFADEESLPKRGDILRVSYRYAVPIRVTVEDTASIQQVKALSQIPGDTGVREMPDVDVNGKVFSHEAALRYGQQYLAVRSAMILQGSVSSNSVLTGGSAPRSGQALGFALPAAGIERTEVVTQVTIRHKAAGVGEMDYAISFGKLPDEFLLPVEAPNIRPQQSLSYDVMQITDIVSLSSSVTFTDL